MQKLVNMALEGPYMETPDMELPAPEELADWIRSMRNEHGITQTELAARIGLSPSQISRLEGQKGDASYKTMYRLQQALRTMAEASTTATVRDILDAKHQRYDDTYRFVSAQAGDTLHAVAEIMDDLDISQMPVFDGDTSIGRITQQDILKADDIHSPVKQHMRPPFPEIGEDTPVSIARDLLQSNEAVLVRYSEGNEDQEDDHPYAGIVTPADFSGVDINF